MHHNTVGVLLFLSTAVSAVGAMDYPTFRGEHLRYGKVIWQLNCQTCHAYGVADAPNPQNPEEWGFRLAKGKDTLYDHAINGFFGKDDAYMPPRGGNEKLSNNEVKAAVDYMARIAGFYIQQHEGK